MEVITLEDGELCQICNQYYQTIWWAKQNVWLAVTGEDQHSGGLFCPTCFEKVAKKKGFTLRWGCTDGEFPVFADERDPLTISEWEENHTSMVKEIKRLTEILDKNRIEY
jgi:hypothetical protein